MIHLPPPSAKAESRTEERGETFAKAESRTEERGFAKAESRTEERGGRRERPAERGETPETESCFECVQKGRGLIVNGSLLFLCSGEFFNGEQYPTRINSTKNNN